jgi:hypothetical protein
VNDDDSVNHSNSTAKERAYWGHVVFNTHDNRLCLKNSNLRLKNSSSPGAVAKNRQKNGQADGNQDGNEGSNQLPKMATKKTDENASRRESLTNSLNDAIRKARVRML